MPHLGRAVAEPVFVRNQRAARRKREVILLRVLPGKAWPAFAQYTITPTVINPVRGLDIGSVVFDRKMKMENTTMALTAETIW